MSAFTFQKDGSDVVDLVLTPQSFDSDGIWVSDSKSITNFAKITIDVEFEEITPDGADNTVDFRIQAVLQGQADNGKWYNLVSQNSGYFSSEQAPVKRLVFTEAVSDYEPGVEFFQSDALGRPTVATSHEQGSLPDDVRLCIILADRNSNPPNLPLTSVKLSAAGRLAP